MVNEKNRANLHTEMFPLNPLLKLNGVKKKFLTDELETHALWDIHLEVQKGVRSQRLDEMEAWALLRKVMAEIDVVVIAFNDAGNVQLANDAAARALGRASASLLGCDASSVGLADLLGERPLAS